MTVKELIAELNKFNQDESVYVYNMEYSRFEKVGNVVEISKSGYSGVEHCDGILIDGGSEELEIERRKE